MALFDTGRVPVQERAAPVPTWSDTKIGLPVCPDGPELRREILEPVQFVRRMPVHEWQPAHRKVFYEIAKRAMDVLGALMLLLLFLPLLGAIAVLIKLSSPGPVLFKQRRLGRNGKEFWCLKFRTMVPDAEKQLDQDASLRARFEADFKIRNDSRVTPLGALLRRTSLDEFPQIMNVLAGEMSLIGPRPIVPPEISKYGAHGRKLLTVQPGLGGLWQVAGRSDTTYAERVHLDMLYIDHRSLLLDLKLLWLTAFAVIKARGAR